MIEVPFGEWLPDLPDFKNPGLTEAKNVYPSSSGYAPFLKAVGTDNSVTGTILGARRFDRSDGTQVICVGTTSDLFVIVGTTVTASSLSLSVSTNDTWVFEQFGPYVFATSKNEDTYYLSNIESDTSWSAAPGSPPNAEAMARIGDFLLMGNLTDIDASNQVYRVRWSRFNDPAGTWGTDIAFQSGYVDMPTKYGPITGLSGGTTGLVLQKYAVSRIQYVGGASAFRKEVIDEERGCAAAGSVVQVGGVTYWLSFDGFCRSDSANVESISGQRVWKWAQDNINFDQIDRIRGAVDWSRQCVVWAYYGFDRSVYSGLLIYNWQVNRWSYAEIEIDALVETTLDGMTLEQVAAVYTDLDAMTISLDSPIFTSKGRALSVFVSGELSDLKGDALEACLTTGDIQLSPTRRSYVSEVWPIVENQDADTKISMGTRDKPGGTVEYADDVTEGAMGYAPVAADGRFFRVCMKIPAAANWDKATGVQLVARDSGR